MMSIIAELNLVLGWLLGFSVVAFVVGLLALPIVAVRIPTDYFLERSLRCRFMEGRHPVLRMVALGLKNLLGGVLLAAGVIMLFMPGPGVISMLVGLSLLDFPGKRALKRKIVSIPSVFHAINTLRARYGREPLAHPSDG